jgi:hypothetical protein
MRRTAGCTLTTPVLSKKAANSLGARSIRFGYLTFDPGEPALLLKRAQLEVIPVDTLEILLQVLG